MDEGHAQHAPGADAARPSLGLGPVARPPVPARDGSAGPRPPLPLGRPYPGNQRPAPVAPGPGPRAGNGAGAANRRPLAPLGARPGTGAPRTGFGLPSLRRNVCPHFYMTGIRGSVPIQAPHLLKALVRQEYTISRCQLRGGVHLEQGYVNDVCLGSRFNQCVFYEDDLDQ